MTLTTELPSICVVIPAKNEEAFIGRCLTAVLQQEYPARLLEVIVVDNDSSDNTASMAKAFDGVNVLEVKGTISAARNFGARAGSGEVLAFLDADCTPESDWLQKAVATLRQLPKVAVVSAVLELENRRAAPWIEMYWLDYLNSKHREGLNYVATISSFCFLVSRECMESVGWFNESLATCEDSDLGYRIAHQGNKLVVDTAIKTVHLQNAKTVKQFFMRQLWQGGANLKNLVQHQFEFGEMPSILAPLLYLLALLCLPMLLFLQDKLYLVLALLVLLGLPLVVTLRSGVGLNLKSALGYHLLWGLYLAGRGLGMVVKVGGYKK